MYKLLNLRGGAARAAPALVFFCMPAAENQLPSHVQLLGRMQLPSSSGSELRRHTETIPMAEGHQTGNLQAILSHQHADIQTACDLDT